ncbi:MAG: hypothetical protein AAGN66_09295 [Acidobacteriota bacterium]
MPIAERFHAAPLAVGCALLLVLAVSGCRPEGDGGNPEPSEIVDVPPALEIPIEDDIQEKRPAGGGLTGVLPSDFPSDLPLDLPASLVDFGGGGAGQRYVELLSSVGRGPLVESLTSQAAAAGWRVSGQGPHRLERSGQVVTLVVKADSLGTLYRYEY